MPATLARIGFALKWTLPPATVRVSLICSTISLAGHGLAAPTRLGMLPGHRCRFFVFSPAHQFRSFG